MDRLASMETFIRVVETGSFSGAARQLRVGQPAVSKCVSACNFDPLSWGIGFQN
jgi:DNA-binding transcriptional LysR family regulator